MAADPKPLTRDQLAKFLPNHEAVKAFEKLFQMVGETLPDGIEVLIRLSQEASIDANTAASAAQAALEKAESVGQESAANIAAAESKAAEALDALNRIANALEVLALAPGQIDQDHSELDIDHTQLATADYLDLGQRSVKPAHREGRVFYDFADYSLAYYNEAQDVTLNIGREQLVRVFNNTGSTLSDGQAVYVSGASSGWPTVALARADTKATSEVILGVVTSAEIANNAFGYVCISGVVNDLDTSSFTAGSKVYLSASTSGGLTATPPLQPNFVVEVGVVLASSATVGRLLVQTDNKLWFPSVEIIDTTATQNLPTTPTIFKAPTTQYNDGFTYDASTGVLTINNSGSYTLTHQFNAEPSAANKNIYFYVEEDTGSGWQIKRYSGRQLKLPNAEELQVVVTASRYYPTGSKIRVYIWGDATVALKTTDLPGTTPGTVTKPAYRFLVA